MTSAYDIRQAILSPLRPSQSSIFLSGSTQRFYSATIPILRRHLRVNTVTFFMRLLHIENTVTAPEAGTSAPLQICFREFYGEIPPYVILSHRWRDEEVSYLDMIDSNPFKARNKKGYSKIERCCRIALQMSLSYAWVDTCCIDKASSAELSEAINSMYKWYANSAICLAYLDDVGNVDVHHPASSFKNSSWFSRGWTLQELIAPWTLEFFSQTWVSLGRKSDPNVRSAVAEACEVSEEVLEEPESIDRFCAATKFAWASSRETTRPEDEAYCLLGLFGVNIPPLYGEGQQRAFRRLQLEIMQVSHDHTLFCWNSQYPPSDMLASSARDFYAGRDYARVSVEEYVADSLRFRATKNLEPKLDYAMTNVGLQIQLLLCNVPKYPNLFFALLACRRRHKSSSEITAICLQRSEHRQVRRYRRIAFNGSTVYNFPPAALSDFLPWLETVCISKIESVLTLDSSYSYAWNKKELGLGCLRFEIDASEYYSFLRTTMEVASDDCFAETFTSEIRVGQFGHKAILLQSAWPIDIVFGEIDMKLWFSVRPTPPHDPSLDGSWMTLIDKDFTFPTGAKWSTFPDTIMVLPTGWSFKVLPCRWGNMGFDLHLSTNLYNARVNRDSRVKVVIKETRNVPLPEAVQEVKKISWNKIKRQILHKGTGQSLS